MVTPVSPIVLSSSTGNLTVTLDPQGVGGWCQVHLVVSGMTRPLGAERLKYIAAHLLAFIDDTSTSQHWVLSLAELHTSAYGEHVATGAVIRLQDAEATFFSRLELTPAELAEWRQQLLPYAAS
jgi:hypothetical protein